MTTASAAAAASRDGLNRPSDTSAPGRACTLDVMTLAGRLKALADPVRLKILEFLRDPVRECCTQPGGVCACDLESFLKLSQPTVSHHMKLLVQAGFVTAEKRGRWVFYTLDPAAFGELGVELSRFEVAAA